ncbi:agmatinase [Clostridium formicaceticum]|uniref:Agmatinase n=1 Tax=Clostridium formicaceticum TaxID=1497 RepID=A0AAC9RJR4_9CLOT|nr:agmatinase [Clostridium formicaceticum]AOY75995.1 agmatinase [Clostridium formicaceticum]ARE86348.1 Guanidinobutyrase [Clostridium formicaceticum]
MKYRLPWGEIYTDKIDEADIIVLGIPFDSAVSNRKGAAEAPDKLRELSRILPPVTEEGLLLRNFKVYDHENVEITLDWEKYFKQVEETAFSLMKTGKTCLFIGGDHAVTIPLETAFAKIHKEEKIGIIHFDSHPDIIDTYDGHPWSHACTQRRALEIKNIAPEDLTFVGLRSYMEEELAYFEKHPEIKIIGAREVYRKGIDYVIEVLKEKYKDYTKLYITLDIDVLDPAFAPGTGTPEAGGLSTRELMEVVREIILTLPVAVVDVVEVAPPLDTSDITSWAALKIIYEIFGAVYKKKMNKE